MSTPTKQQEQANESMAVERQRDELLEVLRQVKADYQHIMSPELVKHFGTTKAQVYRVLEAAIASTPTESEQSAKDVKEFTE